MKNAPTPAARKLLHKLEALAERGIGGEAESAKKKLARLKNRYDFAMPDKGVKDLLNIHITKSNKTTPVCKIAEPDILVAVKWAFENTFGIPCWYSGDVLLAQVTPATAKNLETAALTIADGFRKLWATFRRVGLDSDRSCFMAGLWDGMMKDERKSGQPLPTRIAGPVSRKRRGAPAPQLSVHPYSVATDLGRQIRFSASLDNINNELENKLTGLLK